MSAHEQLPSVNRLEDYQRGLQHGYDLALAHVIDILNANGIEAPKDLTQGKVAKIG